MEAGLTTSLAKHLDAASIGNYREDAPGGSLFVERMPQGADTAIALYSRGGFEADSREPYDLPTVQVIVRAASAQDALALAAEVYSELHGLHSVELSDGTWLVSCIAIQSSPERLGPDAQGHEEYSLNFRLEIRSPTAHRS